MRFSFGLLVGYCMRGKQQLLITILAITTFIVFVVFPAIALTGLAISVQHRRHSGPAQTRVPYIEGLEYETASARLRSSNLKIQVLATRSDLRLEPGIIVNQVPQQANSETGEVTDIKVVSGLSHGLSERAIEAAKLIKFVPAESNGKEVPFKILLEYKFNLY